MDVLKATSEKDWRERVEKLLAETDSSSRPADGWPWPWEDSRTTDYAYTFSKDSVCVSAFGRKYLTIAEYHAVSADPEKSEAHHNSKKDEVFPNMKSRQAVTFGKRSGLMVFRG